MSNFNKIGINVDIADYQVFVADGM